MSHQVCTRCAMKDGKPFDPHAEPYFCSPCWVEMQYVPVPLQMPQVEPPGNN